MASRYGTAQTNLGDRRRRREQQDRSLESYNAQQDTMKMQAGMVLGKALLNKRTANIGESEAHLGIKSKEAVGSIEEGTNLYTDTKQTGATTIGGKFKQGVSNLYENVTGDYVEQNPEAIAQVKSQATGELTQTDQMTTLYGSTTAGEYMDKFKGERSTISKVDQMPSIGGSDPTMDYDSAQMPAGMYDDLVQNRQDGGVGVRSNFGQTAGNAFQTSTPVRDPNLATSGYNPSNAMLNRMRDDQEATIDAEIGVEQIDTAEGMGIANYKTYQAPATNTPFDREALQDAQATGKHTAKTALMDAKYGGDRAAASDKVAASLKNFEFGDEGVQSVDPMNTSIDGSGDYPNYSRNNAVTAKKKGDEFYEKFGDDVEFIPGRGPVPKAPNVEVESEDEFFDEDIKVDEVVDDDSWMDDPTWDEAVPARPTAKERYFDKRDASNKEQGTGKYSDPDVEVESDEFGNEIGAGDVESRDDLAELGVVPDTDTLPSIEEGLKTEISATNVADIVDKKQDVKEVAKKISKNTRVSQVIKGAKDVKGTISKAAIIANDDATVAEKLEAGADLVKQGGTKLASKQIEKQAAKETGKMAADILADKGIENVTDIVVRQASKKAAKEAAKAALSIPASVITGAMDVVSGGEEAGAAGHAGDEVGEVFGKAKQVSGLTSIAGGVITAVGLLANLVPGPGTALSAAITPIGIGMMTGGAAGSVASSIGQIGSSIAQSKRGTTVGRSYKKKFKDIGERYA